jgi:hypothetical protein
MSKIKTVCWGLLAVLGVGFVEPVVLAATPIEKLPSTAQAPVAAPVIRDINLANIFNGTTVPTTIRLRDLTPDWRGMGTNGPVEIGNLQAVINTSAGGSFAASYYTRGQTITVGSETYIVAYSLLTLIDKITPDAPLSLSLLNLRTVGSLSNIRPFEVVRETKILEKQLAIIKLANTFDPTANTPDEKPPVDTTPMPAPEEIKPPVRKPVRKKPRTRIRRRS